MKADFKGEGNENFDLGLWNQRKKNFFPSG